ncbi:hypothetical protein KIN20_021940 [Parelaphostrongylus tenuis]|uniref:Uncharacterized protein n=1 Tax=Parelaphostrongylus tenuis TaxID=148309 RepID=A0AAD5N565_PARTN|nr:hypothetical protein KIN20_021940 [Parelaphostrongylus tenuis]
MEHHRVPLDKTPHFPTGLSAWCSDYEPQRIPMNEGIAPTKLSRHQREVMLKRKTISIKWKFPLLKEQTWCQFGTCLLTSKGSMAW